MKTKFAAVLLVLVGLTGCSQNPSTVSTGDASEAVSKLTYSKDSRTKLCFAIVASRGTMEAHQNGLTITYVPCTPEVEAQIGK
jgi:hypothetical protein